MNDQYHKKERKFMQMGMPSILLAIVMVCLITFSALSFLTVHSDYVLSQKNAENSLRYYKVEGQAYLKLSMIDQALLHTYQVTDSAEAYFTSLSEALTPYEGDYYTEGDKSYYSFSERISEKQKLEVILCVNYPKELDEAFYQINSWKIMTSDDANEESSYQLADPSNRDERKDE